MSKRKNLLFLMTDHQRFDSLDMFQSNIEITPNLNRLKADSVFFTRAYNTCPLCVPARTALASGVYPTSNGVIYNDWSGEFSTNQETIYTALLEEGYSVAHVGVDHIRCFPLIEDLPLDFYFSQKDYDLFASENGVNPNRDPQNLTSVNELVDGDVRTNKYSNTNVGLWPYETKYFKDYVFTDQAMHFLEQQEDGKPFALFVCLWAPHPPLVVPDEAIAPFANITVELPENVGKQAISEPTSRRRGIPAQLAEGIDRRQWEETWKAHLALTRFADECLGRLIDQLHVKDLFDDTVIVFTPDHGEHLGQHSMYQKMEMYEEAVRVPLILRPGESKPLEISEVVSHLDILPTLVDLLDLGAPPVKAKGRSLVPLIEEQEIQWINEAFIQYSGNPGLGDIRRCLVNSEYKYVFDGFEHELYHLTTDPHEMFNVAGEPEQKHRVQKMYEACRAYHLHHGDPFPWDETNEVNQQKKERI